MHLRRQSSGRAAKRRDDAPRKASARQGRERQTRKAPLGPDPGGPGVADQSQGHPIDPTEDDISSVLDGHLAVPPAFDVAAAKERLGGDLGLLAEIARTFLTDAPRMLMRIDEAIVAMDAARLQAASHELCGAAANIGAAAVAESSQRLEASSRARGLHAAARERERLYAAMDELILALTRFLVEPAPRQA
jgi:HPt (histidine-containing phosphotransfer) domain-containing protein